MNKQEWEVNLINLKKDCSVLLTYSKMIGRTRENVGREAWLNEVLDQANRVCTLTRALIKALE